MVLSSPNEHMSMTSLPHRLSSLLLVAGVLSLGPAGCEKGAPPGATVEDSAGVQIVVTRDPPDRIAEMEPEPVLSIGGPDAIGPGQFLGVLHVQVDSRGRLWVADGASAEIRIFHDDGAHWKTLGGRGEGPGEFRRVGLLGGFAGDSIAVWDNGLGRLTVYGPEGSLVRTRALQAEDGGPLRCADVFRDGSLLCQLPTVLMASSLTPGQLLGDSVRLVRVGVEAGGTRQLPVTTVAGPTWLWTGEAQVPLPFTTNAGFDIRGESVLLVQGPFFRVRMLEDGVLSRVYALDRDPRPVTEFDVEAYRGFAEEYVPDRRRTGFLSALDHPSIPGRLPAYSRVLSASDGTIWVRRYTADPLAPAVWDVFGPEGDGLGSVTAPRGFSAMSIRDGRIVGVWRDEMGVEHVRAYRLKEAS